MSDLGELDTMNKVYEEILREHLGEEPLPARTTFQAGRVPKDARSIFLCLILFNSVDIAVDDVFFWGVGGGVTIWFSLLKVFEGACTVQIGAMCTVRSVTFALVPIL